MATNADEQALRTALGFSSFGAAPRARKRVRRAPPSHPRPLAQFMPGTELGGASSPASVRGPHGVLCLVKASQVDGQALLRALREQPEGVTSVVEAHEDRSEAERRGAKLLGRLQRAKTHFDALDSERFLAARRACNAFERLGRHRFLNRSAMKLATLDFVFGWTAAAAERPEAFTFADICGGPGGFSEYLLWRLQQQIGTAKRGEHQRRVDGFGITLRDAANRCDWRLPSRLARVVAADESPATGSDHGGHGAVEGESLATFTVCYGADGTGDVYSLANVRSFRDAVLARQPSGVALAVADGGFQDARDRDNQEAVMTRLVMAETLAMFSVLEPGGDFVCKTFELATPAMRQLAWLLHQCFAELTVVKPITSRPASSERYIVARNLHTNLPLQDVVKRLEVCITSAASSSETPALLPNLDPFDDDDAFHQFMAVANDTFAAAQIAACEHIMEFAESTAAKQAAIRDENHRRVDPAQYYACWRLDDA